MIKMHKTKIGSTKLFEFSMVIFIIDKKIHLIRKLIINLFFQYVKEGIYYYYFIVDGKIRFAPDQPSCQEKRQKIVNFTSIDSYMLEKADEERKKLQTEQNPKKIKKKIKSIEDCVAGEYSWKLSDNF